MKHLPDAYIQDENKNYGDRKEMTMYTQVCPHCGKKIKVKNKKKDYIKMIELLEPYDGKSLSTEKIKEIFVDYYSTSTNIADTMLVVRGILEKRGWGLYLVKVPDKENINFYKRYNKIIEVNGNHYYTKTKQEVTNGS